MEGEGKGCIAHRSHRGMLENEINTVNTTNELETIGQTLLIWGSESSEI